ncbi:hypothetical protein LFL97_38200 (plasmid) [Burkholderia sp. JSH-S8]|nr:hypothetical protein LFL97_38200 [Burkholderia sp. JSH-S8]
MTVVDADAPPAHRKTPAHAARLHQRREPSPHAGFVGISGIAGARRSAEPGRSRYASTSMLPASDLLARHRGVTRSRKADRIAICVNITMDIF